MSYILDALKKSQAEQAAAGVALRMHQSTPRKRANAWLILVLVLVLAVNAGLVAWIFLLQDAPDEIEAAAAQSASTVAAEPAPAAPQTSSTPGAVPEPAPAPAPIAVDLSPPTPERESSGTVAASPASAPARLPRVNLQDLPRAEQALYNGFNYSTHIYTDDPSLCAIVVDGQRLQVGDAFKGLTVTAITEQGVIFEENRRGVAREVEVDLLAQWEG
jgi:flagellar basal body-associated protein FliL